jgi:hypothetical protein
MKRQTDIEIYVRDCPIERIVAWLETVVGPVGKGEACGEAFAHATSIGTVVITPQIEGGPFVGVWFPTPNSPWLTDVDCGRQAARELGCVVRCDPGQHYPDVPLWASDQFLEITGGTERIVTWECAEDEAQEGIEN